MVHSRKTLILKTILKQSYIIRLFLLPKTSWIKMAISTKDNCPQRIGHQGEICHIDPFAYNVLLRSRIQPANHVRVQAAHNHEHDCYNSLHSAEVAPLYPRVVISSPVLTGGLESPCCLDHTSLGVRPRDHFEPLQGTSQHCTSHDRVLFTKYSPLTPDDSF